MTPYAILLVKPTDSDDVIRKAYHAKAKNLHPDRTALTSEWYTATAAYTAVKTADMRSAWERKRLLLAGACQACAGSGVAGTRMFKGSIRLCASCKGEGRG